MIAKAGRKPITPSSGGSVNARLLMRRIARLEVSIARLTETVAIQEKRIDELVLECRGHWRGYEAHFAAHDRWLDELLDPIKVTKWTGQPQPHPFTLRRTKKGAKQASETASKASAKVRDTSERDMNIASCVNALLDPKTGGEYANDDEIIDALEDPLKTPWQEEFGDLPGRDRLKKIFTRLRKANMIPPARRGRKESSS
jgi:hypothetical protein